MIVGKGLIGSAFEKLASEELKENFIIYASGVSNSSKEDLLGYEREEKLLISPLTSTDLPIIYFSSILSETVDLPYYKHKLNMEKIVKNSSRHLIFRIPQVIGFGGNKNTLFNFLKSSIENNLQINTSKETKRSLVDVDDLVHIVDHCKNLQGTLLLSKIEMVSVIDLCEMIGEKIGKKPLINIVDNDFHNWSFENSQVVDKVLKELKIEVEGYTERLVEKYI